MRKLKFPRVLLAAAGLGVLLAPVSRGGGAGPVGALIPPEQPLKFEANQGQHDPRVAFVARGENYFLSLMPTAVQVELQRHMATLEEFKPDAPRRQGRTVHRVGFSIELLGADRHASLQGLGRVAGRANYFIGNDPAQWHVAVPSYDRVRVRAVYPGIDLLHYGNQQRLEYDFEIAPGADPAGIRLHYSGVRDLEISPAGELVIRLGAEELRQPKPVAYQVVNGSRRRIEASYRLVDQNTVTFALGNYDPSLQLVIDPILGYSTYFNAPGDDRPWAIAVGPDGDVYLAGETMSSSGLATPGAFQGNLGGVYAGHGDVFVSRHDNSASLTDVYVTYLGGTAHDVGFGLAVDKDGSALVTGYTASANFPTRSAIQGAIAGQPPFGLPHPPLDCFIARVGPLGTNLVFSTFYGGSGSGYFGEGDDVGRAVALDFAGNIFVTGNTYSTNFPTKNTLQTSLNGLDDAFVLKLDGAGTNVLYAMYLGGSGSDYGRDIAVPVGGEPVVVGYTFSANFPVTPAALQTNLNRATNFSSLEDGFIARLQSALGAVTYASYLGGTNGDRALTVDTDATGAAYVAGLSLSGDFPVSSTNFASAVQTNTSQPDAFVSKLAANNAGLDYSILFGGAERDLVWGLAVDQHGQAHLTGETASLDFPTRDVNELLRATNSGGIDAFVAEINADGQAFVYSAYLGGAQTDRGYAVAIDPAGHSYFVGETVFGTFPTSNPGVARGDLDAFVFKLLVQPPLAISASNGWVEVAWPGYSTEFVLQSTPDLLVTNLWSEVSPLESIYTNGMHVIRTAPTNTAEFFRLKR